MLFNLSDKDFKQFSEIVIARRGKFRIKRRATPKTMAALEAGLPHAACVLCPHTGAKLWVSVVEYQWTDPNTIMCYLKGE